MRLCMFHPNDHPLERGWVGRVDGDRVVHLAAQTLQHFFSGGSGAREHAEYPLAEVTLLVPVLYPPSVRVFESPSAFEFANPAAVLGPGSEVPAPAAALVVLPRLAAIVGAEGAIGGVTALARATRPGAFTAQGPRLRARARPARGDVRRARRRAVRAHARGWADASELRGSAETDWDAALALAGENTARADRGRPRKPSHRSCRRHSAGRGSWCCAPARSGPSPARWQRDERRDCRLAHRRTRQGACAARRQGDDARPDRRSRRPPLPPDRRGRQARQPQAGPFAGGHRGRERRRRAPDAPLSRTATSSRVTVAVGESVTTSFYGRPVEGRLVGGAVRGGALRLDRQDAAARSRCRRRGARPWPARRGLAALGRLARAARARRRRRWRRRPAPVPDADRDRRARQPHEEDTWIGPAGRGRRRRRFDRWRTAAAAR